MGNNTLTNRRGVALPLILILAVVVLGGLYYEQSRFLSLKKGFVRASTLANGRMLERYLSAQVSCALTQAQSCGTPIALLLQSGASMVSAGVNEIGKYRLKAKCRSADQAILVQYTGIKESNFDNAVEFVLCSPP